MPDAFSALGFVHAQDRLWQMEVLLRRGIGRYAEWVGKSAVPADALARRVDTAGASIRDFAMLGRESREMLEAYARGVNAFIAGRKWPLEYAILKTEPIRWEPWHAIAVMRQIGFLMGSVWWKLWRAAALPIVGPEAVSKLRFDDAGDDLRCIPPGEAGQRYLAALGDLQPAVEALLGAQQVMEVGGGSNNWALSPQRTTTGRPLLAGDPHRVLEMPNMYYQTHLACDDFDVIGLTVPGVPGFPHYGHSKHVAWCVTHAFMDIHDLFVEQLDDKRTRYRTKAGWEPTVRRTETIKVRGEADSEIEVVETGHGPIIVDDGKGPALALRSVQFAVIDRSFDCMLPMLRATSVDALYDATREWGLIDHNLVAGDIVGHIGNRVRAKVPLRPRANGWLPVPGWSGEHEWNGMIPFDQMPHCIDPEGGLIVTANNRVTENDPHYLSTDSMPPHRARRIWQRLQAAPKHGTEEMAAIHRDRVSLVAREFIERLSPLKLNGAAAALQATITAWNGEMNADSAAAAAYAAVRAALTKLVFRCSGLAASANYQATVPPGVFGESQLWWTLPQLLRTDDVALLGGRNWDELLREAIETVAAETTQPAWGSVHTPVLRHPLSSIFPEHSALLDKPCGEIGGDNDTVFATGYVARVGMRATYASLCRYVVDVGGWDNCSWIVFHGASGHTGSPWYDNQNARWAAGELVPMLYDWAKIEATAAARQTLSPAG
jgi:penicillin amidase